MTWQGSGGLGAPGDPDDDATRVDNPVPASAPPPFTPPADDAATDPAPSMPPAAPPAAPTSAGLPPAPAPQAPAPWAAPSAGGGWAAVPPDAGRLAVPGAPGLVYGGAVPRLVAYLVDVVLLFVIESIIAAPFAPAAINEAVTTGGALDPANPMLGATSGLTTIIGLLIGAAYFTFLWSSGGRATVGMRLLKLQIGDATTGNRISVATAFRRWLAFGSWLGLVGFVPGLGLVGSTLEFGWLLILLLTTAVHPQRQGLHDRFANTAMVRPVNAGSGGYVIGCILIAVVLVLLSLVSLIFLGSQVSSILSDIGESV